jgi:hypothetical protein
LNLEVGYDLNTLLGSVALNYKLVLGEDADGDTPIYWGSVASGRAYYYWVDADGVRSMHSGTYYFDTGRAQSYSIFSSPDFTVYGVKNDNTSGVISLSSYSNGINLYGGVWDYKCSLDNGDSYAQQYGSVSIAYSRYDYPIYYQNPSSGTQFNSMFAKDNGGSEISYTNLATLHRDFPNVPYIPVSGNKTYNDIRNYIVNQYNNQNPEETITTDDLPDIDGNLPTEESTTETDAVEPSYNIQPFSIDYDEILGEKEMESIIAETRYILDTAPLESIDFSFPETLPEASVPDSNIVSTVDKIFEMHKGIVPPELVTIWGGLAVFAVLFWWITK